MGAKGKPGQEAAPGDVTADHIEASTSGLAAGIINDGVRISNYYGGDGPAIEPIRWQGPVADASPSVLNVAPLARTRPKTFATYIPRDQDDDIRALLKKEPFVVLGGPPLAGKTRTLTEIAKELFRDATVIVPDPDSEFCLAKVDDVLPAGEIVIWLDDLDRYLRSTGSRLTSGLTYPMLEAWLAAGRGLHVLATIRTDAWHEVKRASREQPDPDGSADGRFAPRPDRTGWDVLQRGASIDLAGPVSDRERAAASAAFGVDVPDGVSFGEFLYEGEEAVPAALAAAGPVAPVVVPPAEVVAEPLVTEAVPLFSGSPLPPAPPQPGFTMTATDLRALAQQQGLIGNIPAAIATGERLVATFGQATDPVTQVAVAGGLYDLAFAYARAGRFDLAITAGERLVGTFGESTDPEIRVAVSGGLCNLAFAYANAAQIAQAISTGERLLAMFGEAPEPGVQVAVARGLRDLAVAYAAAGRLDLSIAAGERLIRTFEGSSVPGIQTAVAWGLYNLAFAYANAGRLDMSIGAGERLVSEQPTEPEARVAIARGYFNLAIAYATAGRIDLATATEDRLIAAFGAAPEPEFRDVVERVMQNRALRNPTGLT